MCRFFPPPWTSVPRTGRSGICTWRRGTRSSGGRPGPGFGPRGGGPGRGRRAVLPVLLPAGVPVLPQDDASRPRLDLAVPPHEPPADGPGSTRSFGVIRHAIPPTAPSSVGRRAER
ncbi:hypothetical protein THAOC_08698, partial [Thalassiosira oceanica]